MGVFGAVKSGISRAQSGKAAIESEIVQTKNVLPNAKPLKAPEVKQPKQVSDKKLFKNRLFTFVGALILFALAGLTGLLSISNLAKSYVFSSLIFLVYGALYLWAAKKIPVINDATFFKEVLVIFLVYLCGIIGYSTAYYFLNLYYSDNDIFILVFLASTVAFLIPFLMVKTVQMGTAIQPRHFKSWFFPEYMVDSTGDWDPRKHVFVTLVFSKSIDADRRTEVKSKFPLNAGLSSIIYEFVNDYNANRDPMNPIRDLRVGEWFFYVKARFGKKRRLDPDLNIRENKILENEKIYLERVL